MQKTPLTILAAAAALTLASCTTITPEEEASAQTAVELAHAQTTNSVPEETLQQARSIKILPVQRQRFIQAFQLQDITSKRYPTSTQAGVIDHTESWTLPNGLTLLAYNHEILPSQQYYHTLTQIRNKEATSPEQPLFRFFEIKNHNGKTIYASLDQKDISPSPKP